MLKNLNLKLIKRYQSRRGSRFIHLFIYSSGIMAIFVFFCVLTCNPKEQRKRFALCPNRADRCWAVKRAGPSKKV